MTGEDLRLKIQKFGMKFDNEVMFDLYISLITKPFVILTGISGSGKTKIAESFAIALSTDETQYCLIPVKPNWNDNKGIFGYHNVIDDTYMITAPVKLMIRALQNPDKPYFLILDEMNIAKVENYFSDYLSLIESRKSIRKPVAKTQSETITYAAFDIDKPGSFLEVEAYRKNRFSICWKAYNWKGDNWTASIRTELNQQGKRKANKLFEHNGKKGNESKYMLKDKTTLLGTDLTEYNRLYTQFKGFDKEYSEERIQDNLILHNCTFCLGSNGTECPKKSTCPYTGKPNEMYLCPDIYDSGDVYFVPPQMPIPWNFFTIGTVNVDETTYMFSPKVLDRANVIELNSNEIVEVYHLEKEFANILTNVKQFSNNDCYFDKTVEIDKEMKVNLAMPMDTEYVIQNYSDIYKDILRIYNALQLYNMAFGYRVINEMSKYILNVCRLSKKDEVAEYALDIQILQKILPKMNGTFEKLNSPIIEILKICSKFAKKWSDIKSIEDLQSSISKELKADVDLRNLNGNQFNDLFKYPRSAEKLINMLIQINEQGITSFIQ